LSKGTTDFCLRRLRRAYRAPPFALKIKKQRKSVPEFEKDSMIDTNHFPQQKRKEF